MNEDSETIDFDSRKLCPNGECTGVLDASECPPTFGTPPEMVVLGASPMAFKTHAAIMHLCRLGYREEAEVCRWIASAIRDILQDLALPLREFRMGH